LTARTTGRNDVGLHRFVARAMASPLCLTLHADAATAHQAWRSVQDEFAASEAELSRFRRTSALTRLNQAVSEGACRLTTRRVMAFVGLAHRAYRVTEGTFDPRVIADLEAIGERAGIDLPSGRRDVSPWFERDGRHAVRLVAPVDSGGLGKGLALRWARSRLEHAGLMGSGGLIDAGGDLVMWGRPPDTDRWRVAIEHTDGGGLPAAVIVPEASGLATSSVRVRSWTGPDGSPVHHLLDPRTGRPADGGLRSVTVAFSDPAWAEVYSKHLFIGGAERIAVDARRRSLAAWWITDGGRMGMTAAAARRTLWLNPGMQSVS
jgi:thiamine biosynthesis lipoprotein